ncbi:MAG: hypothetical protein LBB76_02290 [Azoarcus sp.]|jgi:hypothetical protein|nr:hypothetical protein [Azoarcus sp.]
MNYVIARRAAIRTTRPARFQFRRATRNAKEKTRNRGQEKPGAANHGYQYGCNGRNLLFGSKRSNEPVNETGEIVHDEFCHYSPAFRSGLKAGKACLQTMQKQQKSGAMSGVGEIDL